MHRLHLAAAAVVVAASLAAGATGAMAATHAAGRATTVAAAGSHLGRILVDGQGRTLYLFEKDVYLFEKDAQGRSSCTGACAAYWPPLLTHGKPAAHGSVKQSLLGVTHRGDGTSQVTYAGHPLYRFVQDTKPGQANGQGLDVYGAEWYVLSPAGTKLER
jgi:predicted lipoprotein with Yx(FWY)xxD motif